MTRTIYTKADCAIAMDVLERFMQNDPDSSRSRCIQVLIPYFGIGTATAMVQSMIRSGVLMQVQGIHRAFRTVLTKGGNWQKKYMETHKEE